MKQFTDEQIQISIDNAKIPTSEIQTDIIDTQREILDMKRKIEGYRLIGDKLSMFRADAMVSGIAEREKFIEKLQTILEIRKTL